MGFALHGRKIRGGVVGECVCFSVLDGRTHDFVVIYFFSLIGVELVALTNRCGDHDDM
jgi:hypothetical protein